MDQFAAKYIAEQDRILLRVGFSDKEAQLWVTRRLLKLLWPLLGKIAAEIAKPLAVTVPQQQEISEFQREAALQAADFKTEYHTERAPVWKDGPLLATCLVMKSLASGQPVLCLQNEQGVGVELPMDPAVHSGICELIRKCVADSGWDLALEYGSKRETSMTSSLH